MGVPAFPSSLGPRASEAILGILVANGFLVKRQERFQLTDVARNYLLPHSPYYWGGVFALLRDFPMNGSTLFEAMKKDERRTFSAGEDERAIAEEWATGDVDSEQARVFTAAMHSHSFPAAMGVAQWGGKNWDIHNPAQAGQAAVKGERLVVDRGYSVGLGSIRGRGKRVRARSSQLMIHMHTS